MTLVITIADIAKKAGVSYSTVSRALADSALVNPETKRRIQALAEESGYQVNQVARSLVTRTSHTLGLVIPETLNPYFPKLIDHLVRQARAAGYSLLLNISGSDQQEEGRCLRSLYERRVDGIILTSGLHGLVAKDEVFSLVQRGVPLVALGWLEEAGAIDLVACDDAAGAGALTRHLLALGHRRIVLLGPKECRSRYDRIRGFQQALEAAGLPLDDSLRLGVYTEQDVRETVRALLAQPEPPTALFAYNDAQAIWTLSCLADAGIAVPQQMAVVGFGDVDLAGHLNPRLTTVAYPIESVAEAAVSLLLRRIADKAAGLPPQRVMLTPRLVARQSCGFHAQQSTNGGILS
jgi:LacI family transcriptional regulator